MTSTTDVRIALERASAHRISRRRRIKRTALPLVLLVPLSGTAAVAAGLDPLELVRSNAAQDTGLAIASEPIELRSAADATRSWTFSSYISRDGSLAQAIGVDGQPAPAVGGRGGAAIAVDAADDGLLLGGTKELGDDRLLIVGATVGDAEPQVASDTREIARSIADRTLTYTVNHNTEDLSADFAQIVKAMPDELDLRPFALTVATPGSASAAEVDVVASKDGPRLTVR